MGGTPVPQERTLKTFFLITFALLILLSFIAWKSAPSSGDASRTQLVWTTDDNPLRRAQIEPFNRLYPSLHIDIDPSNAELEKVLVQSLAGVGPDVFDCYEGFSLTAFVKADIAWDVTDELKRMNIDVAKECWPAVLPHCMHEGRVYGHPVNAAANGLWFHKDILEEAGVEIPKGPWTWDLALPVLRKLVKKDARGKTIQYPLVFDWDNNYLQFLYQWGARMYSEDGTRCTLDSPEAIAAVTFMEKLVREGIVPDQAAEKTLAASGGYGGAQVITLFAGKRAACALGGRWWLCVFRQPEYADLKLGAAEAPYGTVRAYAGYGKATCVNKHSPRRNEALKFLAYLHSEDYNRLINHQADGVGPVKKYVEGPEFLHDPAYPAEDFNAVWREIQTVALAEQVSPFMNGAVMKRLMRGQLDLIKTGDLSAEQAMREATRMINERIEENLRQSPALRKRYDELVRKHGD
jgi:multiple sugar transport system substrate-binding protein